MNKGNALKKLTPEATIHQILASGKNTDALLRSIGMNPELYQNDTLRAACQQLKWNEEELLTWLKKHHQEVECIENKPETADFGDDIAAWSNWMLATGQPCIQKLADEIGRNLPRVHLIHGNQYPWLKYARPEFESLKELLDRYLLLEQQTLLPLVKELSAQGAAMLYGKAKNLQRALELLDEDRGKISAKIAAICCHSSGFRQWPGTCSTLRITIKNLENLSRQLQSYFRVEEKSVFPLIKQTLRTT